MIRKLLCGAVLASSVLAFSVTNAEAAVGREFFLPPDSGEYSIPAGMTTINRIDSSLIRAGDTIYLSENGHYNDLVIYEIQGQSRKPVTITSHGTATISPSSGNGVTIMNSSHVTLENVHVKGGSTGTGITIWQDGDTAMKDITVNSVKTEGFYTGLYAGTSATSVRITDLDILNSSFSEARDNNLITSSPTGSRGLSDVTVSNVVAHSASGDPSASKNTGSGIILSGVTGGVIENSHAYNNGTLSNAPEGPEGIWAYSSDNIIIRNNVSENNKTSRTDGNGFGFDIDVHDSAMTGNVSRNNDGVGYLIYTYGDWDTRNILVENNTSIHDSRKNYSWGPITVSGGIGSSRGSGYVSDVVIRNNSITMDEADEREAIMVMSNTRNITVSGNNVTRSGGEKVDSPPVVHPDNPSSQSLGSSLPTN